MAIFHCYVSSPEGTTYMLQPAWEDFNDVKQIKDY